jgi:hypothetical protein
VGDVGPAAAGGVGRGLRDGVVGRRCTLTPP